MRSKPMIFLRINQSLKTVKFLTHGKKYFILNKNENKKPKLKNLGFYNIN